MGNIFIYTELYTEAHSGIFTMTLIIRGSVFSEILKFSIFVNSQNTWRIL